jgi:hypothetical protein
LSRPKVVRIRTRRGVVVLGDDAARGGEAVEPRHPDVHQHEVRGPDAVPTLLRDDHPKSRELRLGLTEKEDEFKFSADVAPEARSEEDVSAADSFVFSGDVSDERKGRLAGACEVADKGEPTCHATPPSTMARSRLPACRTSARTPRPSNSP